MKNRLLPLVSCLAVLVLWQGLVFFLKPEVFPGPVAVVRGTWDLLSTGVLLKYIFASLFRVTTGFILAMVLGIPFGLMLGFTPVLERLFNPLIQIMRPISPIAWIPIAILLFGITDLAPIFMIFLASFFPILTSTISAVHAIPEKYLKVARIQNFSRSKTIYRVVFPATAPALLSSARISFGIAWMVVVAAEMVAVNSGLGYLIIDARNAGMRYDLVVAGMLIIGIIGLTLDQLFRQVEKSDFVKWGLNK